MCERVGISLPARFYFRRATDTLWDMAKCLKCRGQFNRNPRSGLGRLYCDKCMPKEPPGPKGLAEQLEGVSVNVKNKKSQDR